MAKTQTVTSLIAAGTSNAAGLGNYQRGVLDVRAQDGGFLTLKLVNGPTGPTAQAECRVLAAHNTGATPAAASAGAVWKTVYKFGGGINANAVTERSYFFGPEITHIEVEVNGNNGQGVGCEAVASTYVYS